MAPPVEPGPSSTEFSTTGAETSSSARTGDRTRWVIAASVAVRVVAAAVLVLGPWTDDRDELTGWDVERFAEIAALDGRPWRDTPVEYPPGSVVVFEVLGRMVQVVTGGVDGPDGLPSTHRSLVLLTLAADLGLARLLFRRRRRAAAAYLMLGLPLVPMGLLRLDIVVTALAVLAVLVAIESRPGSSTTASVLTAAAGSLKVWPGLVVPALWAVRRERAAVGAVLVSTLAVGLWLWWAGAGIDPLRQVIELRGATGWHVESLGGSLTVLADAVGLAPLEADGEPRLELNAFRIGRLRPGLVTVGRLAAVALTIALAVQARRSDSGPGRSNQHDADGPLRSPVAVAAAVVLGSVAALIVTAPLLSPQFLLWLTPWAALLVGTGPGTGAGTGTGPLPPPVLVTAAAVVLTGATLAAFGPPGLAQPLPAALLTVRNLLLVWLPFSCWRWLARTDPRFAG